MTCPTCNEVLLISDKNGIELDYCPKCRGIWLDRGELDKLIEVAASAAMPPVAQPEPQRASPPPPPPAPPRSPVAEAVPRNMRDALGERGGTGGREASGFERGGHRVPLGDDPRASEYRSRQRDDDDDD